MDHTAGSSGERKVWRYSAARALATSAALTFTGGRQRRGSESRGPFSCRVHDAEFVLGRIGIIDQGGTTKVSTSA